MKRFALMNVCADGRRCGYGAPAYARHRQLAICVMMLCAAIEDDADIAARHLLIRRRRCSFNAFLAPSHAPIEADAGRWPHSPCHALLHDDAAPITELAPTNAEASWRRYVDWRQQIPSPHDSFFGVILIAATDMMCVTTFRVDYITFSIRPAYLIDFGDGE